MFKNTKAFSGFSVDDIAKAKDFYGGVLGVNMEDSPEGGLILKIAGGNPIFVYPKSHHQPATFTILNFQVPNIEEAVDQLTAKGIRFIQYDEEGMKTDEKGINRSGGPLMAWFKDPAGNFLSVLESGE